LGEIGYVDEDGYVFITDRFSDMVVSGGVNIYPAEAENVLMEHSAVLDVACIGVPHAENGRGIEGADYPCGMRPTTRIHRKFFSSARDRLSHYKCPRTIEFVTDLGRNSMGKINKRTLRAPYWEGHS